MAWDGNHPCLARASMRDVLPGNEEIIPFPQFSLNAPATEMAVRARVCTHARAPRGRFVDFAICE